MSPIPYQFEHWFQQFHKYDLKMKIQAIDRLFETKDPNLEKILIEIIEREKNEEITKITIKYLGQLRVSDMSNIYNTFKKLLLNGNVEIRKCTIQAISNSADISAIKYLTKYYYSEHSEGVKSDVKEALDKLLKVLDDKMPELDNKTKKKKQTQKKLIDKPLKGKEDIDYKEHIKKYFE